MVAVNVMNGLIILMGLLMVVSKGEDVTYDGRALIINGTRRILFSGSIHYPRSTPDMWPSLIAKAKEGDLDVIQTYVFWNVHEPIQGQYNFEGRYDLVKFIKLVQAQGLYVSLRIGPFIQAEWKYGGLPLWLHDVPDIVYRSDNEPFKFHMQKFVTMIVNLMKSNKLYASLGGPIILSQIENEYKTVEAAFREKGPSYVIWAASMAQSLQTGVPWMMCKQDDAPDLVINACNGLNCGTTFAGPNSPQKPAIWTENWTFEYQTYGEDPRPRPAEDLAFSVALFIAKRQGSFVNYYMYHGGTNFGKSASAYVLTSYYDQAPLDEYGLIWLPTWKHLKELHSAIKKSSETLLWGDQKNYTLGEQQEALVFQSNSGKCSAFLVNNGKHTAKVKFSGANYQLPRRSVSILPDCKNVAFNTAKLSGQYGSRKAKPVQLLEQNQQWKSLQENVPTVKTANAFTAKGLLEQISIIKDSTDYLWYTIRYKSKEDGKQVLHVDSRAHVLHVFVNDKLAGTIHGSHDNQRNIVFEQSIFVKQGMNSISLLSVMVGLPDSGPYLEKRVTGLRYVRFQTPGQPWQDLTKKIWSYQVGLQGENKTIYTDNQSNKVRWDSIESSINQPLVWYKTTFNAPSGTEPLALDLSSMGKGEVWINGESIGRYWVTFKDPSGKPSQTMYHVPRSFLRSSRNLLVIFEEMGGNPLDITLNSISVTGVSGKVAQLNSPTFTEKEHSKFRLRYNQSAQLHISTFQATKIP